VPSSTIDSATLNRSNQLPAFKCIRDHVFGVSASRQTDSAIVSIASGVPTSDKDDCLIYSAAALGVVHDLKTNRQAFFDTHTDDISCLAVCKALRLVASGQVGKSPPLLLWTYSFSSRGECITTAIATIGQGFFSRMVVSAAISPDGLFVAAVGGDDHHSLGIWEIRTGYLCITATTQNGIPPQIRSMIWASSRVSTEWISSSENVGLCDLLVTAGERHLKFWSFARPAKAETPGSIKSCGAKIGKVRIAFY
jgi:WD40 repeat protein